MDLLYFTSLKQNSNDRIISWLQRRGLLPDPLYCGDCNRNMLLVRRSDNKVDGYAWRCSGCDKKRSLRTNSVFANIPKIALGDALLLLYFWSESESRKKTARHTNISENAVSRFFRLLEDVCAENLIRYPLPPFGGPNTVVQCDESKFNHKSKYNRGRRGQETWVFGVITNEYQPSRGYYQVVPRRDRATLLPILDKCLKAGSIIHTDDWAAYGNLQQLLPQKVAIHRVVNHSHNFVDPVTGVHTQNIEAKWHELKQCVKERRGIERNDLNAYLAERMWKEWKGEDDVLNNFMSCLSLGHPNIPV